jgi:hypothetical protein
MMVRQSKVGEQALSAAPKTTVQASVPRIARALDSRDVESAATQREERSVERLAEVRRDGIRARK